MKLRTEYRKRTKHNLLKALHAIRFLSLRVCYIKSKYQAEGQKKKLKAVNVIHERDNEAFVVVA